MKIGIIVGNSGINDAGLDERRRFLAGHARPGTEVAVIKAEGGPASIESEFEKEWASTKIVERMIALQDQGFDAFIPWCGGDPGVIAGRERVRQVVVGPLQSACAYAALLGFRFSIVTPTSSPRLIRQRVAALGLGGNLASVRQLNRPVLTLRADLDGTRRLVIDAVEAAAREDGADAVVLACLALFGFPATLENPPLPVIDPSLAALSMAESLVAMSLSHSPLAYPFPKATHP